MRALARRTSNMVFETLKVCVFVREADGAFVSLSDMRSLAREIDAARAKERRGGGGARGIGADTGEQRLRLQVRVPQLRQQVRNKGLGGRPEAASSVNVAMWLCALSLIHI